MLVFLSLVFFSCVFIVTHQRQIPCIYVNFALNLILDDKFLKSMNLDSITVKLCDDVISLHPHISLLLLLFVGSAVMCGFQPGDSLLLRGEMHGRENPLRTPHLHVMEHLQNRDLPP